jgi:polyisoprenoid-binding protein YceI
MNKTYILILSLAIMACNQKQSDTNTEKNKADSTKIASPNDEKWIIDSQSSSITWKGTKPNGEHIGTIKLAKGNLFIKNKAITSGNFIIDMTSIKETSNTNDPKAQNKLVKHLKSDDFFNVGIYPTSKFEISKVLNDSIYGNLTIKNITRSIQFLYKMTMVEDTFEAIAAFEIDRTEWGINYKSGKILKDKILDNVIGDKIPFKIVIKANKSE